VEADRIRDRAVPAHTVAFTRVALFSNVPQYNVPQYGASEALPPLLDMALSIRAPGGL